MAFMATPLYVTLLIVMSAAFVSSCATPTTSIILVPLPTVCAQLTLVAEAVVAPELAASNAMAARTAAGRTKADRNAATSRRHGSDFLRVQNICRRVWGLAQRQPGWTECGGESGEKEQRRDGIRTGVAVARVSHKWKPEVGAVNKIGH